MSIELYKVRQGKIVSGVLAGIAHKLGWEWVTRAIFIAGLLLGKSFLLLIALYIAQLIFYLIRKIGTRNAMEQVHVR